MLGDFYDVDGVHINVEVVTTRFECDLKECNGACCTMESDFGAPTGESEIREIEKILQIVKKYIPQENVEVIENSGFWYRRRDELMINSVNRRECVFSFYEGNIAKCGIEKAFRKGEIDFVKPISCHLFPIRVGKFGGDVLRFEKYSECESALKKGMDTDSKVFHFCKDALERKYGREWFLKLVELARD
ncbi:MAG: hypothetical protein A2V66_05355 [Ignavibacteria bacterium RBG_13_36_8]|nr:MAG: hypothetical protein A2V66_05355 [Ignavibacteria bacterium RBG_13_36_8]